MLLVKSHTYTINMDNCAYFRAGRPDEGMNGKKGMTIFTMNNGSVVQITCDYDTVMKQLKAHNLKAQSQWHYTVLTLEY